MAGLIGSVWAIDIGNNSLKAMQLSDAGGTVEVIGFDVIPHNKILTGSGITDDEREELIAISLRQFVSQNNITKENLIISVPSQNSFARFVKLPPVEKKRIPEIINFEAAQQIPFDINDVQWDYQLMDEGNSAELKVGLFAIKNEVVNSSLEPFTREGLQASFVQMASMALYNYLVYDRGDLVKSDSEATVVLNMGAENTDLVVCTKSSVWQRCIPMGGNSFTRAIANAFKINFEKAEKLKRTAAMSKYARQILQAMKPVFTDLSSEIQRSIGFYSSSNPNVKVKRVIAFGGGTKMRGLLKYLQQSLQIPFEMPDSFKNLTIGESVSAAQFHENICDFGVVYGLGVQALGYGRIENNLLPKNIARSMSWSNKSTYFILAASMLLAMAILGFVLTTWDRINYSKNAEPRQKISSIINIADQASSSVSEQEARGLVSEAVITKALEPYKYRDTIPLVNQLIYSTLPNAKNNPAQKELYQAYESDDVEKVLEIPRSERKQIFITGVSVYFSPNIEKAPFIGIDFQKGRTSQEGGDGPDKGGGAMDGMDMEAFMGITPNKGVPGTPPLSKKKPSKNTTAAPGDKETSAGGPGFVISIAGYSPYKNINELLDPVGAKDDDPSTWGIVTRMIHLDKVLDSNSPFVLFEKSTSTHFRLDTGEVSREEAMPGGIGVESLRFEKTAGPDGAAVENEQVLIDAMTKEIISKVTALDDKGAKVIDRQGKPVYQINDHWFTIDIKFKWKDAPAAPVEEKGKKKRR